MFSSDSLVNSKDSVSRGRMPRICMLIASMVLSSIPAIADGPALSHKVQQKLPIKLGTSGFNSNVWCDTGTLGSLVIDTNEKIYILSNNHVLARENLARIGEPIQQTGPADTFGCLNLGTLQVAKLSAFEPLVNGNGTVDAAIAETDKTKTDPTGFILDVGTLVLPAVINPTLGLKVRKSGRTSGDTHGIIYSVNVTSTITYRPGLRTTFRGQIGVVGLVPVAFFSEAGDSGSLVVTDSGNTISANRPVGLLFGGDFLRISAFGIDLFGIDLTFANPVSQVLNAASFRGLGLQFVGKTPAEGPEPDPPSDPAVSAASQVKDRYDDFLLSLPQVVGHGVGFSRDGSGRVVIQVFLEDPTPEALQAVPAFLDGIQLETIVTGPLVPR
jgi:hypothetical protein